MSSPPATRVAISFCLAFYKRRDPRLVGLDEAQQVGAGAGYTFLVNKYYLDDLYENVIVRAVAHPISSAAYWINQNVLDATVDGVGESGKRTGQWVYENIDQEIVDGAVDGAHRRTSHPKPSRPASTQSGRSTSTAH